MAREVERRSFLKAGAALGLGAGAATMLPSWVSPALAAPVTVSLSGSRRPLNRRFFGVNGNNTRARLAWDRADLGTALTNLGPGVIRYPGGAIGNYWDWRAGWFQPNGPWDGQLGYDGQVLEPFDNSLGPFRIALQRTGAQALFMLNMLTVDGRVATSADSPRMLADQIAFLRGAQSAGIGVQRIELGNEFYLSSANAPTYSVRFPTAASYAQEANDWATALRAEFPAAQIAAVGTNATNVNSARREGWNAELLAALSGIGIVTMHPYIYLNPNLDSATPQSILSMPHAQLEALEREEFPQFASRGITVWATEFNMIDKTSTLRFAGTWLHGLFLAAYALLLAHRSVFTRLDLHNVVGQALQGALFDTTTGFGSPTPVTPFLGRTAVGMTYGMLLQATRTSSVGQALAFGGGPVLSGGAAGLVGMDFVNGAQHQAVVVNLSPGPVTLDVRNVFAGTVQWSRITAPSLTTRVIGPSSVTTASGNSTATLNLPRHSITRIST